MPTDEGSTAEIANLMSAWYSKKLLSQLESKAHMFTREYMNIHPNDKVYIEDILNQTRRVMIMNTVY